MFNFINNQKHETLLNFNAVLTTYSMSFNLIQLLENEHSHERMGVRSKQNTEDYKQSTKD